MPSSDSSLRSGTARSVRAPPSSTIARTPAYSGSVGSRRLRSTTVDSGSPRRRRCWRYPVRQRSVLAARNAAYAGGTAAHAQQRGNARRRRCTSDPNAASHSRMRLFEHRVEHRREVAGRGVDDLQTSAVAVCCSSASRVSVISRAFSIAITACAAKFCSSAICLSENGRTSWR